MKKIAILTVSSLFFLSVALGQPMSPGDATTKEPTKESKAMKKLAGGEVSIQSRNSFIEDFPGISDVTWKRSENFDEASFTNKEGKQLTAFYDEESNLVGTTQYVTFDKVPLKGQQEIKDKYKDYNIGKVVFFDDNEANESDMILWAAQFDDEDNYFVALSKGDKNIIVKVDSNGAISFFKELK